MQCRQCGKEAPPEAVFCMSCGTRLHPASDRRASIAPPRESVTQPEKTQAPQVTMTAGPSDVVKDLLRRGRRNEAMKLYRREGATDQDINYLNTADSIATERGISIEDALDDISKGPPAGRRRAPESVSSKEAGYTNRELGCIAVMVGVGAILIVGALIINATSGGGGGSSQSTTAKLSGSIPAIETVGVPFDMHLTLSNGSVDLPHVTLDLGGCQDHWVLDNISSPLGTGTKAEAGDYYVFGSVVAQGSVDITLTLVPKDAGNHTCDIAVYGDTDASTGIPSGSPLDSVSASVAINP